MGSATKFQEGFQLGVTPRQLADAKQAAQDALNAFVQPEEIRPGQMLCCRGRVIRAVTIAGQRPQEEWPRLHIEIDRLTAIVEERRQRWLVAERAYRELCTKAVVEPELSEGETCTCEGCKIEEENIRLVETAQDRRSPLPQQLWRRFKDFAEARTVQTSYRYQYKTALGFDQDTGEYVLVAGQSAA